MFLSNAAKRAIRLGAAAASVAVAAVVAAPAAQASPGAAHPSLPDDISPSMVRSMVDDAAVSRPEAVRRLHSQDAKDALADRLTRTLGTRAAGAFIDRDSGRLVVNVTSADAADRVRSTTARPRVVEHSMAQLRRIQARLERTAVTGTTLAVDVRGNTVDVTVPDSGGARLAEFAARAESYGPAVDVEHVAGAPRTRAVYGGEAIYGGGHRCSTAFIASSGGTEYVITAGHCTNAVSSWSVDEGALGPSVDSTFPGSDYGLIRNDGGRNLVGQIINGGSPYEITGAGNPPVGTYVCKTGSTTSTTCGYIQQYNVTVNYPSGTVRDLIETDVCTQSGDSGGGLFASGNQAVGIVSGGTTLPCSSPSFQAYFENVTEALGAYGVTLE